MKDRFLLDVVHAWHEALNKLDIPRMLDLSAPNIEIVGPRGSAVGLTILENWLNTAGLSLEIQSSYQKGADIVVAEHGVWRNVQTKELVDEANVATHFKVADGKVAYLARYDDLTTALAQAGLTTADQVKLT